MSVGLKWSNSHREIHFRTPYIHLLSEWTGRLYGRLGPGTVIHSSYRHGLGFIISRHGADPVGLKEKDFFNVETFSWQEGRISGSGEGSPPVESLLHGMVYQVRSSAIFCFTISRQEGLFFKKGVSLPQIPWPEDPSAIILSDLENSLGTGNGFAMTNGCFLSFGCTVEDAVRQIEDWLESV